MAKMNKKWVILCTTAVAAAYTTGFLSTEEQALKMDSSLQQNSGQIEVQPASKSLVEEKNGNGNTSNVAAVQKNNLPNQRYKDGIFTGTGMNRRGNIEVSVTLKKDKIIDVQISNWGMHYSESDINGLPGEVIQRQSANVDFVSGATYSTQAFADAVQDALKQAQNS